jgi:hypothetical protein
LSKIAALANSAFDLNADEGGVVDPGSLENTGFKGLSGNLPAYLVTPFFLPIARI